MGNIGIEAATDMELVRRVLDGDREEFAHLMERYGRFVSTIVKRHVPADRVEEVVQEVFIKAYKSLSNIEKADSFKGWISTITVRSCYDFWRRHYRASEIPMNSLDDDHRMWLKQAVADHSEDEWSRLGRKKEAKTILDWALGRLKPEDRMVLELVHLEEKSCKEAAQLLGWSVANVKVRAFRSRKKLQKLLMESGWR